MFCASVDHAAKISEMLCERGVKAESISGRDKPEVRNCILDGYEHGNIDVLCACDLLNEGWDSPHTTVLFMARPTMSKTIYMQQLGRGTRKCEGKKDLLVFDFVDNANMFNQAYSLHRLLDIARYQPLGYVLAPESGWKFDRDMLYKGEKPTVYLDMPIDVDDFETIDLFNWQNTVKDMISQIEFVRMVDVQSETVDKYVRAGKIKPDLAVPIGEKRFFNYYTEDSVHAIAKQFHWDLITDSNMAEKFMGFIETMDMSFSYKPVLLKAMFDYVDMNGKVRIEDIVDYFINFYEMRKEAGLVAEK
ncbi:MAG: helicase-related protein, partial [Ruthenibacterium sp.]